jgi:hypothetical protein
VVIFAALLSVGIWGYPFLRAVARYFVGREPIGERPDPPDREISN